MVADKFKFWRRDKKKEAIAPVKQVVYSLYHFAGMDSGWMPFGVFASVEAAQARADTFAKEIQWDKYGYAYFGKSTNGNWKICEEELQK